MSEHTKSPCPACRENGKDRSGDNLIGYGEGRGAHCFACGYHEHGDGKAKPGSKLGKPIQGKVLSLPNRRIDERTTRLFDYRKAKLGDQVVHVANYLKDGTLVAQHIRYPDKGFKWKGDTQDLPLYGQWLWSGKGKRIVITEGEIDCLSVSMLWENRWPVVSLPSGANHGAKAIQTNLDFLSGYDEVVLCFDNDDAGRAASEACADILPPGKVRIAHLPHKDANECILRGERHAVLSAIYEARTYQPDGVLHVSDIDLADGPKQDIWTFPWDSLTKSLMGQRSGEMTLWASGTGSGKSTVMREIAIHHLMRGRRVGMVMLEESPQETLDDLIALKLCKPVRQIKAARELNRLLQEEKGEPVDFGLPDDLSDEEMTESRSFFRELPLYIYDHHGSNEFTNILQRIEYMAAGLECDVIIIDHVTALVAGMERQGNERETIDYVMKQLRSIVERTGVHLDVVSQLNRLDGKPAEEGGQISLKNLRGSGSLGSVPNTVIAIERNQQHEDVNERRKIGIRSLKGRFNGETGLASCLIFNTQTRRLEESDFNPGDTDEQPFPIETEQHPDLSGLLDESGHSAGHPELAAVC